MRRFKRAVVASAVVAAIAVTPGIGLGDVGWSGDTGSRTARAATAGYASFRIVKAAPSAPTAPEISLPAGYSFLSGSQYQVASRAEYYSFISGVPAAAVELSVRWPGERIAAVVSGKSRLALRQDTTDPERVFFSLAVTSASASAAQPTLQVWSSLSASAASGVRWRVEHNGPDRAAGYWTGVTWPATQATAVINYMTAVHEILQDSGLVAEAVRRGHFFYLMGFETNNSLHSDNPPHWHLAYYPGLTTDAAKATVPHFWVDAKGATFYNGQDVQGKGRTKYRVGEPAPIRDAEGKLVLTTTIRADGGLDIAPRTGPRYSITSRTGNFADQLTVLRGGLRWRSIRVGDNTATGILWTDVRGASTVASTGQYTQYTYDWLTGKISQTSRRPVQPGLTGPGLTKPALTAQGQ